MEQWSRHGLRMKLFVKEKNEYEDEKLKNEGKYFPVAPLTGEKAKQLYQEIISESLIGSSTQRRSKRSKRRGKKTVTKPILKNSNIFFLAQNNDVVQMNLLLSQQPNIDVNATDDFGWTPLMCASCSGAQDAVVYLLENKANAATRDKSGYTAASLAKRNNYPNIVTIIRNWQSKIECEKEKTASKLIEPFFCDTCQDHFKSNRAEHEHSTLHLFNTKSKPAPTFYGIPETNRGFQLMLRKGWNKEKGLGPEGSGMKYPVKTKMKKDRRGIGAPVSKASKELIDNKKSYSTRIKRNEKSFERSFRLEFS